MYHEDATSSEPATSRKLMMRCLAIAIVAPAAPPDQLFVVPEPPKTGRAPAPFQNILDNSAVGLLWGIRGIHVGGHDARDCRLPEWHIDALFWQTDSRFWLPNLQLRPSLWDEILNDISRIDDAGGFGSSAKILVITSSATSTSEALVDTDDLDDDKADSSIAATTDTATTTGALVGRTRRRKPSGIFRRRKAFKNTFRKASSRTSAHRQS